MTLRLWSWPMKCQRNSGWAVALASSSWARFSPSSVSPASCEDVEVLERDVLDGGEQLDLVGAAAGLARGRLDLGPHALEPAPHRLDLDAVDQARHTTPACRPVTPPSRRWEKNSPNQHIVHSPTSWTCSTPAACELVARDLRQVEVALADAGVVALEDLVDLLADLVAAAARRRAERGLDRALGAELAQRGHALGHDPRRQPAPAAVQRRDRAVGDQHHRQAVGHEHERRRVLQRGRLPVLGRVRPLRPGRLGGAAHGRLVDLAAVEEALARRADRRGQPGAVLVDVLAGVVGQPAEVERGERALGDAAAAGGEQHLAAGQGGADVLVAPGEGLGQVHALIVAGPPAPPPAAPRGRSRSVEHRRRRRRRAPRPIAGPSRPAASRSSPVIASFAWRRSSSQRLRLLGRAQRAGQRDRLGRLAPQQRPDRRRVLHAAQHRRERPRAGGGGGDRVALAGGELAGVEAPREVRRGGVEAGRGQRHEVRAAVGGRQALRALDEVGVDVEARQQPRADAERLERRTPPPAAARRAAAAARCPAARA